MNILKKLFAVSLVLTVLMIPALNAQKNLTMEEAVIGMWREYYPEYRRNIQWRPDTQYFTYIDGENLMQESAKKSKTSEIINLSALNQHLENEGMEKLRYFPSIAWKTKDSFTFQAGKDIICFNVKDKKIIKQLELPENAGDIDVSPTDNGIAFTVENNLSFKNNQKTVKITDNENTGLVAGQTVARSEFGITNGIFWSPKGNKIAYYLKDESMVSDYPLVNITTRVASVDNTKYPMAGEKSEETKLHIYTLDNAKDIEVKTEGDAEQFLTCISWTPDEKHILIAVLNRAQNHMKLNMYNADNGNFVKTLFEEKHEKYVEPQHSALFIPEKNNEFIWQSNRDGYNHLYLYNTQGKLLKQLTKGDWEVTDILGFSPKADFLVYQSTEVSPIERHIYKLDLNSGKSLQLTEQAGTHNAQLSSDGKYILDNYSSTDVPNAYDIISTKGKYIRNILTAKNPLEDVAMGKMEIGKIKAADGKTDLFYRLILPPDFDPNKKYPTVVYVYGGPHAQLINNCWLGDARGWQFLMAQKGYVMFTLDGRGSANRGMEFENCIHRQLGVNEMADQMKGIEFLTALNYVDADRIGVHGWSFGGFMTTNLMLNHPDVFKVGVAGGPVIDWSLYEVMYGERYMDTPQENPEGYDANNLAKQCTKLKGKLLMIHGGIDPTVVQQHSLVFVRECIKNQIPVDYFVYPRAEHNVRGYDRIHLMQKVTDYFDDYLK